MKSDEQVIAEALEKYHRSRSRRLTLADIQAMIRILDEKKVPQDRRTTTFR